MIPQGTPALRATEIMEAIRAHVLAEAPEVAAALEELRAISWVDHPVVERAALAVCAWQGLNPAVPANRRRARTVAESLLSGEVASPGGSSGLPPRNAEGLRHSLHWICSSSFVYELRASPGPLPALRLVNRRCPALKGPRASRFLAFLAFPAFVMDGPRVRWLRRLGWIDPAEKSHARARDEGLRFLVALSVQADMPLWEIDRVAGVFTGAEGHGEAVSLCGRNPRCGRCPARENCSYATAMSLSAASVHEEGNGSRRLREAMPEADMPREKLMRAGAEGLTDAELLAILVRTGNGRQHAVELAGAVLRQAGSLGQLSRYSIAELTRLRGLGPVKAVTIKAALELARRLAPRDEEPQLPAVACGRTVYELVRGRFLNARRETFLVLLLNAKNRVQREVVVSEGILNQTLMHPREAFQEAVKDGAAAVILVHNHPSGDPAPSRNDRAVTRRLVEAGRVIGIPVLDHVIVGEGRYYSFEEAGTLLED